MSYMLKPRLLLTLLLGTLASGSASGQSSSADTQRILDSITAKQPQLKAADSAAARQRTAAGDRAYRRHQYGAAFQAYRDSYPNAASAYAYIMAGDAHWREVLQHARKTPAGETCRLKNTYFVHDLSLDLSQNQQVGLALLDRHFPGSALEPGFVRHVREETTCLQSMVEQYGAAHAASCVDLQQLERCLGAPLIQ